MWRAMSTAMVGFIEVVLLHILILSTLLIESVSMERLVIARASGSNSTPCTKTSPSNTLPCQIIFQAKSRILTHRCTMGISHHVRLNQTLRSPCRNESYTSRCMLWSRDGLPFVPTAVIVSNEETSLWLMILTLIWVLLPLVHRSILLVRIPFPIWATLAILRQ